MKLLRVGSEGHVKPAILDREGRARDLSAHLKDIDGEALQPESLARIKAIDVESLPIVPEGIRIGACVARPLNFVCIGLNYADHAKEAGLELPSEPMLFLKSLGSYSGPFDDIVLPEGSIHTDWEVELAIVIGKKAKNVSESTASKHVAGYRVVNDVSEREYQLRRGGPGTREKDATRSDLSDPSWSPRTRSGIRAA